MPKASSMRINSSSLKRAKMASQQKEDGKDASSTELVGHTLQPAPPTDTIPEPKSEAKLIKSLKGQIEKLHRDLKTANTQLSNARSQKTKAAEEHKAQLEKLSRQHAKNHIVISKELKESSKVMMDLTAVAERQTSQINDLKKREDLFEEFNSDLQVEFESYDLLWNKKDAVPDAPGATFKSLGWYKNCLQKWAKLYAESEGKLAATVAMVESMKTKHAREIQKITDDTQKYATAEVESILLAMYEAVGIQHTIASRVNAKAKTAKITALKMGIATEEMKKEVKEVMLGADGQKGKFVADPNKTAETDTIVQKSSNLISPTVLNTAPNAHPPTVSIKPHTQPAAVKTQQPAVTSARSQASLPRNQHTIVIDNQPAASITQNPTCGKSTRATRIHDCTLCPKCVALRASLEKDIEAKNDVSDEKWEHLQKELQRLRDLTSARDAEAQQIVNESIVAKFELQEKTEEARSLKCQLEANCDIISKTIYGQYAGSLPPDWMDSYGVVDSLCRSCKKMADHCEELKFKNDQLVKQFTCLCDIKIEMAGKCGNCEAIQSDLDQARTHLDGIKAMSDVGVAIRILFLEEARVAMFGGKPNQLIVREAYNAAHAANAELDNKLFGDGDLTSLEKDHPARLLMQAFKGVYSTDAGDDCDDLPKLLLRVIDCQATIRFATKIPDCGDVDFLLREHHKLSKKLVERFQKFVDGKTPLFEANVNHWFLLDRLEWLTTEILEFDKEKSVERYLQFLDKDGMNPKVNLKLWRGAEMENDDFGFVVKMKPLDWF